MGGRDDETKGYQRHVSVVKESVIRKCSPGFVESRV